MYVYMQIMEIKLLLLENKRGRKTVYGLILTLFRLGFFGFPGPGGGGGASKAGPLHKSESINAIVMKLGD